MRTLALGVIVLWFTVGGVGHFAAAPTFAAIMPPYVPSALHLPIVYVSGALELLLAAGLLWARTRQWAGYGLIALTLAVTPANVHMWMNPAQFDQFPPWVLGARLVLQAGLIWLIWWATRRRAPAKIQSLP